jgi:hypothetical protein
MPLDRDGNWIDDDKPYDGPLSPWEQNNGNAPHVPSAPSPSAPAPTSTPDLSSIFGKYNLAAGETDAANYAAKAPEDRAQFLRDLEEQAKRRAAPTSDRTMDSQGGNYNNDGTLTAQGQQRAKLEGTDPSGYKSGSASPLLQMLQGLAANNYQPLRGGAPKTPPTTAFSPASNPRAALDVPGLQFDDPYTKLYEQTARNQLDRLNGSSELDRLMGLISKQIEGLSNPGYSPEQQAVLNTQAFEPIEDMRAQGQRNVMQRASARGVLPSSGIVEDEAQEADRYYDRLRTVANRDLAINGINKQREDQQRAIQLAQLGMEIPNQLGQQQLGVANSLYQLPRNAMQDSLSVLNASSPQAGIGALIQLLQMQQQQSQFNAGNNAALWGNIGQILAGLV